MAPTGDLRERLSEAQGHRCCWCACDLRTHKPTLEHILPVVCGGTDDPSNLAIACARCNVLRGALMEFRFYLSIGKVRLTNSKRRRFLEWLAEFGDDNFRVAVELSFGANEILDP